MRTGMGPRNNQSPLSSATHRRLQSRLLSWFNRHRRDLPWRVNRDPYRIWVSEVMLQQTQVATVLRYFDPFIRAFPTIQALAAAPEQEVLRRWEGLGYYRRAHHLHQAARRLAAKYGGRIPNDPELFGDLPGVGRYILGAVLSQAFDRRLPIVEANTRRVLCRLLGRKPSHDPNGIERWLWRAAEALSPTHRVGDFNQALMELGALVCTPAKPRCDNCPLKTCCVACRRGLQCEIPGQRPSPNEVVIQEVAVVVHRKNRVLVVQRPLTSRWPGMWEFPHDQVGDRETHESAAQRVIRDLVGLESQLGPEIVTLKHALTRFRITLTCFEARYRAGKFRSRFYRKARWLSPSKIEDLPLSSPQRRLASALLGPRQRRLF
jgi:A/G-specific adenine glycosylase